MGPLQGLAAALFALWAISELAIRVLSARNRIQGSERADRLSYWVVWLTTMAPILLSGLVVNKALLGNGFGALTVPLRALGCLVLACGITIRVMAVILLRRQFTVQVTIVDQHTLIDTGIYGIIRHPAYLGHLASLLGMGLILGNAVSLIAFAVLPLVGILYRIHVEERILLRHFGAAYQAYADRTKRLLPRVW